MDQTQTFYKIRESIDNKLEIFEDALFESGKTSTHRTGITCTLINLNTENGERKKLNWAIFEQLPIYHIHP